MQHQNTRVVAIDLSLTGTGLAYPEALAQRLVLSTVGDKTTSPSITQFIDRVDQLAAMIIKEASIGPGDILIIEGLSLHSKSNMLDRIFASWWMVVKDLMAASGVEPIVVAPQQRAKYATGKGNASKDTVMLAAARRYSDYVITNNNEADALILYAMAQRHLGRPIEQSLPALNLEAMEKVDWDVIS